MDEWAAGDEYSRATLKIKGHYGLIDQDKAGWLIKDEEDRALARNLLEAYIVKTEKMDENDGRAAVVQLINERSHLSLDSLEYYLNRASHAR